MLIAVIARYQCDSCGFKDDWIMGDEYSARRSLDTILEYIQNRVMSGWARTSEDRDLCKNCHITKPLKKEA